MPMPVVATTSRPCTATAPTPMSRFASPSPSAEVKTRGSVPSNCAMFEQQLPSSEPTAPQTVPSSAAIREIAPIGWPPAPETLVQRPSNRCTSDGDASQTDPSAATTIASVPARSVSGMATDPSVEPVASTWTRSPPLVNQMVRSGDTASLDWPSRVAPWSSQSASHATPFQRCGADWYDVAQTAPSGASAMPVSSPGAVGAGMTSANRSPSNQRISPRPDSQTPPPRAGVIVYDPNAGSSR